MNGKKNKNNVEQKHVENEPETSRCVFTDYEL
jgi:hypothetical protein